MWFEFEMKCRPKINQTLARKLIREVTKRRGDGKMNK